MTTRRTAAVLLLAAVVASARGAPVQSPPPPPPLVVRCVDGDGKPVAGAEVHVFQAKLVGDRDYEIVPSGARTSDADGRVTVDRVMLRGGWHEAYVYARVPGTLVGAHHGHPMRQPEAGPWTVVLEPSRTLRGRVVRPPDLTRSRVVIRVADLAGHDPGDDVARGERRRQYPRSFARSHLADVLPDRFDCVVTDDDTFVLHDLPRAADLVLIPDGDGVARTTWSHLGEIVPESTTLELVPGCSVDGALVAPDGSPAADARVELRGTGRALLRRFVATTTAGGRFRVDRLPDESFRVVVTSAAGVLWPQAVTFDKAGATRSLALRLEPGVEVAGTITAGTEPVGGVTITAYATDELLLELATAKTNDAGRFVLRLPGGAVSLRVLPPRAFDAPATRPRFVVKPDDPSLRELRIELQPRR